MPKRAVNQERLSKALVAMVRRTEESLENAAKQGNLHPTDLRCIAYLSTTKQSPSPRDIISHLGLTSGSGTALFDRLEKLGYIARVRSVEDRRSVVIVLDRDAAAKPLALLQKLRKKYQDVTEQFDDDELLVIAKYLEAVANLRTSSEIAAQEKKDASRYDRSFGK